MRAKDRALLRRYFPYLGRGGTQKQAADKRHRGAGVKALCLQKVAAKRRKQERMAAAAEWAVLKSARLQARSERALMAGG